MSRITEKDLELLVKRINEKTGSPVESHTKNPNGTFTANAGNYHLSGAYGGWGLHRIHPSGGVTAIISGYRPKKELYELMQAYLSGLEG